MEQPRRELKLIQNSLYVILRRIREEYVKEVEYWEIKLNSDKIFKKDGIYYFCEAVDEAEIIKDGLIEEPSKNNMISE